MSTMKTTTTAESTWRSSGQLAVFTAVLGLFTENFLYGFIVPILKYMLELRLGLDPAYTQTYTTALLSSLGLVAIFAAPVIGHFADKTPSRKIPLLISLIGCTIGTVLVALTPSVWAVFVGRIIQSVAGTGAWIVSFAMLTDHVDKKNMGKALGFAMSFVTAGVVLGPAAAGSLLQWLGYWPAWAAPIGLIAIDFIARLTMIEIPKKGTAKTDCAAGDSDLLNDSQPNEAQDDERSRLLPSAGDSDSPKPSRTTESTAATEAKPARGFYRVMLTDGSAIVSLLNILTFSIIVAGFDATFPLHLSTTFGWKTGPIGAIFLALLIPAMIAHPFIGGLRDKVGLKWPTSIGWLLMAPLMWFLGVPGIVSLPGLRTRAQCEAAFVATTILIGLVTPLVRGAGTYQLTTTLKAMQEKEPEIFGPHGGTSRLFSLTEVAFSIGLMLGPIVAGTLRDTIGFYYTGCILAFMCIIISVTSFTYMDHKGPRTTENQPASC